MRLYLAGPMRGLPRYNFDAFAVAAAALRAHGHDVYSPAENDSRIGWNPFKEVDPTPQELARMFRWDLQRIVDKMQHDGVDGVALLAGWRQSEGAKLEALVAQRCGVPLYRFDLEYEGLLRPLEAQNLVVAFRHEPAVDA